MNKSIWILCLTLAVTGVLSFDNSASAVLSISGNVVQNSNTINRDPQMSYASMFIVTHF